MLLWIAKLAQARAMVVVAGAAMFVVLGAGLGRDVAERLAPASYEPSSGSDSSLADRRLERALGYDPDGTVIVLARSEGRVTSPAVRRELRTVAASIRNDPVVGHVDTYFTGGGPALISRDRHSTLLVVHTRTNSQQGMIDEAKHLRATLRSRRLDLTLGGFGMGWLEGNETVRDDTVRIEAIALPLVALLLMLVFRGLVAALVPFTVGVVAVVGASLGLKILNEVTPMSILALNMVTVLGLALAVDYGLLLVSRYREELQRAGPGFEALRITMQRAGRTIAYSSVIVASAAAALLLFPQRVIHSIGAGVAFVALFAAVTALLVVPALLALLGGRINSLSLRRKASETGSERWYRYSRFVMRHPARVALPCVMILLALGIPFLHVAFSHPGPEDLPTSRQARQVSDVVRQQFRPGLDAPINVAVTLPRGRAVRADLRQLRRRAERLDGVGGVARPRVIDGRIALLQVFPDGDPHSDSAQDAALEVRSHANLPVAVGGQSAQFADFKAEIGDRLPLAIAVMGLTMIVLLFLMTGSVVLPIKSLVVNGLTLGAAFGVLVFVFEDGRLENLLDYAGDGGIDLGLAVVLFALVFGVVTDYTVFLLARIREEHLAGAPNDEAIARGMQTTGRLITSAALLFCVAVGSLVASTLLPVKEAGLGTAFAVAIDATIVRAGLVPALMRLMGSWNWWAPRPLRRLHERIGWLEPATSPLPAMRVLAPEAERAPVASLEEPEGVTVKRRRITGDDRPPEEEPIPATKPRSGGRGSHEPREND